MCVRAVQLSNITENRSLWKRWCRNLNDATWPEVLCHWRDTSTMSETARLHLLYMLLGPARYTCHRCNRIGNDSVGFGGYMQLFQSPIYIGRLRRSCADTCCTRE